MKNMIFFIAAIVISGCIHAGEKQTDDNSSSNSAVAALNQGSQIVQAIINANYQEFAAGANETLTGENDEKSFIDSCKHLQELYGKPGSFRFLGELQTPLFINQLYAVKFFRTGSDGKKIEQEQLLQLIFGNENGKYKLLGMRFI